MILSVILMACAVSALLAAGAWAIDRLLRDVVLALEGEELLAALVELALRLLQLPLQPLRGAGVGRRPAGLQRAVDRVLTF